MIEAMNDIASFRVRSNVRGEVVRNQRQREWLCCRQSQLSPDGRELRIDATVEWGWRHVDEIGVASRLVLLGQGAKPILQAISTGELAIERVEAPVLLIDHNDVPDAVQSLIEIRGLQFARPGCIPRSGVGEQCD